MRHDSNLGAFTDKTYYDNVSGDWHTFYLLFVTFHMADAIDLMLSVMFVQRHP
jgi:hypothetical protein